MASKDGESSMTKTARIREAHDSITHVLDNCEMASYGSELHRARYALKEALQLLTALESDMAWRDMSTSSPPHDAEFLGLIRGCDSSELRRAVLKYSEDGWLFDGSELKNCWDVIAWLPLPAAPTGGG